MSSIPFLSGLTLLLDKVPDYDEFCLPFTEALDKSICEIIMQSNNAVYTPEMKAILQNMMQSMQPDGSIRSKWKRRNGKMGRFYPENNISMTPVSKYVKHTVYDYLGYSDIDMVKGHMSIANEFAKLMNIEHSAIEKVINEFDSMADFCDISYTLGEYVIAVFFFSIPSLFL